MQKVEVNDLPPKPAVVKNRVQDVIIIKRNGFGDKQMVVPPPPMKTFINQSNSNNEDSSNTTTTTTTTSTSTTNNSTSKSNKSTPLNKQFGQSKLQDSSPKPKARPIIPPPKIITQIPADPHNILKKQKIDTKLLFPKSPIRRRPKPIRSISKDSSTKESTPNPNNLEKNPNLNSSTPQNENKMEKNQDNSENLKSIVDLRDDTASPDFFDDIDNDHDMGGFSPSISPNSSRRNSTNINNISESFNKDNNDKSEDLSDIAKMYAENNTIAKNIGDNKTLEEQIPILIKAQPLDTNEYASHIQKLAKILYDEKYDPKYGEKLHLKFLELLDIIEEFVNYSNPLKSQLYLIIERNFDILIQIGTNYKILDISTKVIRFLTTVMINLNYWELYNLLQWKPSIYHFINLINLDINEIYQKFLNDYQNYSYNKIQQPLPFPRSRIRMRKRKIKKIIDDLDLTAEEKERTAKFFSLNPDTADHDRYIADIVSGRNKQKRTFRPDVKLQHHKIIKKPIPQADKSTAKSSNYDPDVVHECQLPSAEIPHKLCLRRFSRKYELIRHQETVHSKKKKLFKCYVCVKQNPGVGPRIFTRHDTLAKHIRVNHEIFGKEAKAEVAYSKKHAEVVEEGDITVHVGRRKTKVDFELRAHMERTGSDSFGGYLETSDLESGDEEVIFNDPNRQI
ncbi:uncharacterized protein KGF55_001772 [Candida pseudojiufengensis]|uniref:uncharacterized protein n=1 Tax=Candida pseudojiufengensis TaxID=497109 RepID=UPI002224A4C5|nr:uncharacterized protein KGF55_001772 [Candida pseudojiufengensis]KAI5964703.1 hypothetical protein KGF55_001772 [Candida pseudojiufengensis]